MSHTKTISQGTFGHVDGHVKFIWQLCFKGLVLRHFIRPTGSEKYHRAKWAYRPHRQNVYHNYSTVWEWIDNVHSLRFLKIGSLYTRNYDYRLSLMINYDTSDIPKLSPRRIIVSLWRFIICDLATSGTLNTVLCQWMYVTEGLNEELRF